MGYDDPEIEQGEVVKQLCRTTKDTYRGGVSYRQGATNVPYTGKVSERPHFLVPATDGELAENDATRANKVRDKPRKTVQPPGAEPPRAELTGIAEIDGPALRYKIRNALEGLDKSDEGLFTTEGLPKVGVVAGLVGEPVTREQVTSALPGYARS